MEGVDNTFGTPGLKQKQLLQSTKRVLLYMTLYNLCFNSENTQAYQSKCDVDHVTQKTKNHNNSFLSEDLINVGCLDFLILEFAWM